MAGLIPEKIVFDASNGNGARIAGYYYPSSAAEIRGVIQICHGMAEYMSRFEKMIERFNEAGYHVCGIDMQGHGKTYELNKELGYPKGFFGKGRTASDDTLKDVMEMHRLACVRFGEGIPYYIYGHSMGSFVVRSIFSIPEYSCEFSKFVFSSTIGRNPAIGLGRFISGAVCFLGCSRFKGHFLNLIAFGSYNKRIKHPNTVADWICSQNEVVKAYLADPMCGFTFTNNGFDVLFRYVSFIQSNKAYQNLSDAPCFFPYASEDPVGGYGTGVEAVISKMKQNGAHVSSHDYGPYRHELINEPVADEYIRDLLDFYNG